jgi:hypothetical protein
MAWVLKDIGIDFLALCPTDGSESFDYDGVDFLAITLLTGFILWFDKSNRDEWSAQLWYQSFTEFLQLLRR